MTPDQFVWWLRGVLASHRTAGVPIAALIEEELAKVGAPPPTLPTLVAPRDVQLEREMDRVKRQIDESKRGVVWPDIPPRTFTPVVLPASPFTPSEITCGSGKAP